MYSINDQTFSVHFSEHLTREVSADPVQACGVSKPWINPCADGSTTELNVPALSALPALPALPGLSLGYDLEQEYQAIIQDIRGVTTILVTRIQVSSIFVVLTHDHPLIST